MLGAVTILYLLLDFIQKTSPYVFEILHGFHVQHNSKAVIYQMNHWETKYYVVSTHVETKVWLKSSTVSLQEYDEEQKPKHSQIPSLCRLEIQVPTWLFVVTSCKIVHLYQWPS